MACAEAHGPFEMPAAPGGRACWVRVQLVREEGAPSRPCVAAPEDAGAWLADLLMDEPRETFVALLLDAKHRVNAVHRVSIGSLDHCPANPREVFQAALLANAAAVILGHNHPSGDPEPSLNDVDLTERLLAAGEILGIPVLDHIITGDGRHRNMRCLHPELRWQR